MLVGMKGKRDVLGEVPIFRNLPESLLDEILRLCAERTYRKGETVFREGEKAAGFFVVWRGALKVFKVGERGREQILEIEGPGRTVAELPLFDGLPYPASCAALEDTMVLAMPAATFHRLVEANPGLARAVIASLSERLRAMVSLVEEISLRDVRERLAKHFLDLAGDEDEVELPLTNQDIASRIGTVREIVSRTMSRMGQEGVIRVEGRTLRILDRRRLAGRI
jgi:CRP-like cAMP-binding protein